MWFFAERRETRKKTTSTVFFSGGKSALRSLALDLTHLTHQTRMPRVEIIVASCVAWLPCCALASVNHSPDSLCAFFISLSWCWLAGLGCASASSLTLRVAFRSSNVHRVYTQRIYGRFDCAIDTFYIPFYSTFVYLLQPRFIWFDVSANRLLLLFMNMNWGTKKNICVYVSVCVCDGRVPCSNVDASTIGSSISICNWNERKKREWNRLKGKH